MGCAHVISMLKQRVTPYGTELEDTWITSVLFIMFHFASAARKLRVHFTESFLTVLRAPETMIYSVLLPYYIHLSPRVLIILFL